MVGLARDTSGAYRDPMKLATAMPAHQPTGSPAARLSEVTARLAREAAAGGHAAPRLVAISKTYGPNDIRPLLAAGQRLFGENRVQEAAAKWPELKAETAGIELHLVGQLQSNKAEEAVRLFDAIHSLDRESLVVALSRACANAGRQPQLFVQVNIGSEPQKGGVAIEALPALLASARQAGLTVEGLMAVPPSDKDSSPFFALLAKLARRHDLLNLSMGMSGDYDVAARLGATYVRVGSALFGARPLTFGK